MIDDLETVLNLGQSALWLSFAVFLRVGGVLALMPAFGERAVPVRFRLGIAVAVTLLVSPVVAPNIPVVNRLSELILSGLGEVLIGVFLGILLRMFVLGLSIAGTIAAQSTSLSQIFGGSAGVEPQPAIGHIMIVAGLALATMFGLHVRLVALLVESYQTLPFGGPLSGELVAMIGVAHISRLFAFAFSLAAPFLIASVLYNVTLGVINRAMPQLMVSFVGAPVITAGGLFLLLMSLPFALGLWVDALNEFMLSPLEGQR